MKAARILSALVMAILLGGGTIILGAIGLTFAEEYFRIELVNKAAIVVAIPAIFVLLYAWDLGWQLPDRLSRNQPPSIGAQPDSDRQP